MTVTTFLVRLVLATVVLLVCVLIWNFTTNFQVRP
jgi:hypothetical protein